MPIWFLMGLMDCEEFVELEEAPGTFLTNTGRLYCSTRDKWIGSSQIGYYNKVAIYKGSHSNMIHRYIHTLVGRNFHPDYQEGLNVCHINEKLPREFIDCLGNLWIGTDLQNAQDAVAKGRFGVRNGVYLHHEGNRDEWPEGLVVKVTTKAPRKNVTRSKAITDQRKCQLRDDVMCAFNDAGYSIDEIAEVMPLTSGTVSSFIWRSRKRRGISPKRKKKLKENIVLAWQGCGYSRQEIADGMNLSLRQVARYLTNARRSSKSITS